MARRGVLVRDFIREALCGEGGYFCGAASPVLAAPKTLPFREFRGAADYRRALGDLYARGAGFATPCEIFAPWYSYAVARWALAWHRRDGAAAAARGRAAPPLRVVEFGGGTGAHAAHFLDFAREAAPAAYVACRYVGVDASPAMRSRFLERLDRRGHGGVADAVAGDAAGAWALPPGFGDGPAAVVGLELLDNLPHDKVVWREGGACDEVRVDGRDEVAAPAADAWVLRAAALAAPRAAGAEFVPTCVEIKHWFGGSPPNFRTLYLDQIEVDSADFLTNRWLSWSSRSTAEQSGAIRSITRSLKSG
jgi:hypothetical protein